MNLSWSEWRTPWNDNVGGKYLHDIQLIIGNSNRRDALHLDSAFKENVDCFLTGDKKDI
jgi:hypothetical protein